jgi:hypothetical protein
MVLACSAAWNGYRPMTSIDQTTHFLRPVKFDVVADARVVRIGRNASFGRVMLLSRRPATDRYGGKRLCDTLTGTNGEERVVANGASRAYHLLAIRYFASPRGSTMVRKLVRKSLIALTVIAAGALGGSAAALALGAEFAGPGPAVTGNDTGGIFPYSPDVEPVYHQIAGDYCARWGRYAKVTSIHRIYGEYVGFVCYDRPGKIH